MVNSKKRVSLIVPLESMFDRMSSTFIMPRYGTIAIATVIKDAGYEIKAFDEFVKSEIDWDFIKTSDYICFSIMTFCSLKAYELAKKVRTLSDVPIIFGGSHPTVLPQECLEYCDVVVRNEGEETIVEVLKCLELKQKLDHVKGISFKNDSGMFVHNSNRDFIQDFNRPQDISLLHQYKAAGEKTFGKMNTERRYLQVIQTSRGCPFNCKFCVAPKELGTKYRVKTIDTVVCDIRNGIDYLGTNSFFIVDNEFTVDRSRTKKLLVRLIEEFDGCLNLFVFARNEIGKEPEILNLMKKAGVKLLYIGVESVNTKTLQYYNKNLTLEKLSEYVSRIHDVGIGTIGSTILGSDFDTEEDIKSTFSYFVENKFSHAHFYALYEIPTKEKVLGLKQMFDDSRFIHHDWRFFSSGFVIHFPKLIRPSRLQMLIMENYRGFYSSFNRKDENDPLSKTPYSRLAFYMGMVMPEIKVMEQYIPVLQKAEEGLYDQNDQLIEELVLTRYQKNGIPKKVNLVLSNMKTTFS